MVFREADIAVVADEDSEEIQTTGESHSEQFVSRLPHSKRLSDSPDSPSNARSDSENTAKRKRKQYVACDACRFRRVRCERDREDETCQGCIRRGFSCTREYVTQKANENRSSKLLNRARVLFSGKEEQADSSAVRSLSHEASKEPEHLQELALEVSEGSLFAYDSPEGRLNMLQSDDYVVTSLIQCYADNLQRRTPLMADFHTFVDRFERAGRRFDQLSTTDKATSTLILALAARVTDLPIIAGAQAPRARRMKIATELSAFGRKRESACRSLEQRARACVEHTFFNAEPSVDSISALLALQSIQDTDDPHTIKPKPRIYSATAAEQMRYIAMKPGQTTEEQTLLKANAVRSFLVTDSMWSFTSGRPIQITDEDLVLLDASCLRLSPPHIIREHAKTMPAMALVVLLSDHMIMIARGLRRRFTSPFARKSSAQPSRAFFENTLEDIVKLLEACERGEGNKSMGFLERQALRATQLGLAMELAFLHWQCQMAASKARSDPVIAAEFRACVERMHPALYAAMMDLSTTCKRLCDEGMLLGNNLLYSAVSEGADIFLRLPSDVEGGPPFFTLEQKIQGVEHFVHCMKELAWSWPANVRELPDIEHRLSLLQSMLFLETGKRMDDESPTGVSLTELEVPTTQTLTSEPNLNLDWLLQTTPVNEIDLHLLLEDPVYCRPLVKATAKSGRPRPDGVWDVLLGEAL